MQNVYDNGYKLLGQVSKIKEYIDILLQHKKIELEDYREMLKELSFYKSTDIILYDYDNGMGSYVAECFNKEDIVYKWGSHKWRVK